MCPRRKVPPRSKTARFNALEDGVRKNLLVGDVAWRWCNEDYDTADRVPYVGEPDPDNALRFHKATGLNDWRISNGTAAGMMIADRIQGRSSPWQRLYNPTRTCAKEFHGESHSIVGRADDIRPGECGVILEDNKKISVYWDIEGSFTLFPQPAHTRAAR
jgi:hypothetical protein